MVINGDDACKNGSTMVWPEAPALLCIWHVEKNVFANYKKAVPSQEGWAEYLQAWRNLVQSPTIEEYKRRWEEFYIAYSNPKTQTCVDYLLREWLCDGKREHIIVAWTSQYLHFGHTVTSRYVYYL